MSNDVSINVKSKDMTAAGTKSAKKNIDEIGDSAKRVGDIAKGIIAHDVFEKIGQAAARGLKSTFTAAKDLGESVNAVNVSFGASSKEILDWGKNNAASFGLSQRAFNQLAVPMGAILKNTGIDMGTVSDKTISLTERAADMASVFNVDVSEALEAIQAGLRGESDPLEKFGVGLNAAAVEAKALADTGKQSAAALTDQEKMLARVALIMEQTSQVQGDFANTSDDAANAQRIATAEMENAQAVIGQALLPVMAALMSVLAEVARWFQGLPGPIQTVIGVVGILGGVFVILATKIVAAKAALEGMGLTSDGVGGKVKGIGVLAGKAAVGLAALALAGEGLSLMNRDLSVDLEALSIGLERWASKGKISGEAARFMGEHNEKLADSFESLTNWSNFAAGPVQGFMEAISGYEGNITSAEKHLGLLGEALGGLVKDGKADIAAEAFQLIAEKANAAGMETAELRELMPAYANALEVAGAAAEETAGKQEELTDEAKDQKAALDGATQALEDHIAAQRAAVDPVFALRSALSKVKDAQDDYNTALKEHGEGSHQAEDASFDLAEAIADAQSAASSGDLSFGAFEKQLKSWVRQGVLTRKQADSIRSGVRDARKEADKFAGTRTARLKARIDRSSLANANATLNDLARDRVAIIRTHAVAGSNPSIGALMQAQGGITGVSHAAEGGPRGNRVLVGERGPEIVDLAPGSMVHPAGTTQAMLAAGGGGRAVHVVLEFRRTGDQLMDAILVMLRDAIRDQGGDVQAVLGR